MAFRGEELNLYKQLLIKKKCSIPELGSITLNSNVMHWITITLEIFSLHNHLFYWQMKLIAVDLIHVCTFNSCLKIFTSNDGNWLIYQFICLSECFDTSKYMITQSHGYDKKFVVFFFRCSCKEKNSLSACKCFISSLLWMWCGVFFLKVLFNVKSNILWMKQFEFLSHSQYIFFLDVKARFSQSLG